MCKYEIKTIDKIIIDCKCSIDWRPFVYLWATKGETKEKYWELRGEGKENPELAFQYAIQMIKSDYWWDYGFELPDGKGIIMEQYKDTAREAIKTKWQKEINAILNDELDIDHYEELLADLYEYFAPEMPYLTAKARNGDPVEWMFQRLDRFK